MIGTDRLSPAAITAELDSIDGAAKRVLGDQVVSIAFTNATVKDLAPAEMEAVAGYLFALVEREPLKTSPAFQAHRMVLGVLAKELRSFASSAGEPVGLQADLRAATTQTDERRIRARIADEEAAYARHVDDVLGQQEALREREARHAADDETDEPEDGLSATDAPSTPPLAAQSPETDDDPTRYL